MAVQLPPGWVITEMTETLPSLNPGTPAAGAYFARRTFVCRQGNGVFVCASGALEDCEAQAQTAAQSRTQKQPYYQ
tara:strand:- start:2323 stop:2550 length:228 start_codon:yes stop_codon:yes gene_type:complete